MTRVALYLRVSTSDQTCENQDRELRQIGERLGWTIVHTYRDDGISGSKGRDKRPGLDAMLKAVARHQVDLVAAWSVDRLGRSVADLVAIMQEMRAHRVGLYLHLQGLDTETPAGRAMFQMLGVFAEFERAMIQDRINAGMARAKARGTKSGKPIGRQRTGDEVESAILTALGTGQGKRSIARTMGIGVSVVQRVAAQVTI